MRAGVTFLQGLVEARFPNASEVVRHPWDDIIEVRVRYSERELARMFSAEETARRVLRDTTPRARKKYRPSFVKRKYR